MITGFQFEYLCGGVWPVSSVDADCYVNRVGTITVDALGRFIAVARVPVLGGGCHDTKSEPLTEWHDAFMFVVDLISESERFLARATKEGK